MISITYLYYGIESEGDRLRYSRSFEKKPVVVWNLTRTCNLKCLHCYTSSKYVHYQGELTTNEVKEVLEDLASYGIPMLILSGGEPLLRQDIFEIAEYARSLGLRLTLSTNGTLIDDDTARNLKGLFTYVGISLDGIGHTNDMIRGVKGAYKNAIQGIRNVKRKGIKVGVRFTITKYNYKEIESLFNLAENEKIDRLCFYHLVYTGRASSKIDTNLEQKRYILDKIISLTYELLKKNLLTEILTVDNHSDGPYIYIKQIDDEKKQRIYNLLLMNGGNRSGIGIACIDEKGYVHPDQFTRFINLGNVRKQKFSHIWNYEGNIIINMLRNRKRFLKGRCSKCKFLNICNGNMRCRAYAYYGDFWESDPACYLYDEEIIDE